MISKDEPFDTLSEHDALNTANVETHLTEDVSELSLVRQELEGVRADLAKQQDIAVRTLADLDNIRRRAVRDREQWQKTATEHLMTDIIPAMDAMRLGLEAIQKNSQIESMIEGFKMAVDQLERILATHGLQRIDPLGLQFDPNMHECIASVSEPDQQEGIVLQVARCGYRLGEKLLRPASVAIAGSSVQDKK